MFITKVRGLQTHVVGMESGLAEKVGKRNVSAFPPVSTVGKGVPLLAVRPQQCQGTEVVS